MALVMYTHSMLDDARFAWPSLHFPRLLVESCSPHWADLLCLRSTSSKIKWNDRNAAAILEKKTQRIIFSEDEVSQVCQLICAILRIRGQKSFDEPV